jgi:hypothetical protein
MLFVRGIKGKLKLNPAVKIWGGLILFLILIALGFFAFANTVEECSARGGAWIGGALRTSYCAEDPKQAADW